MLVCAGCLILAMCNSLICRIQQCRQIRLHCIFGLIGKAFAQQAEDDLFKSQRAFEIYEIHRNLQLIWGGRSKNDQAQRNTYMLVCAGCLAPAMCNSLICRRQQCCSIRLHRKFSLICKALARPSSGGRWVQTPAGFCRI